MCKILIEGDHFLIIGLMKPTEQWTKQPLPYIFLDHDGGEYWGIFITRDSEVIMFSPCVFVFVCVCVCVCVCLCLSRCLSGQFNYKGLVPHKQYFAGTLLGMFSCASYVSRTHDFIDDVTRWQKRSNFAIDISPSIFELERRSKAQNVGNANGYLSGKFNFRFHVR